MIGNYLELLYSNCKALSKTDSYNSNELSFFLNKQVNDFTLTNGLNTEVEILDLFKSKTYQDLHGLLDLSKYLHVFYLVNSFSEYKNHSGSFDNLGRYRYDASSVKGLGIKNNTVLELIKKTIEEDGFLKSQFKLSNHKSYFYLSHDIDSIYGSLVQDGLWALKNGRFDVLLRLFFNVIISKPHWLNFDLIMNTESDFGFKSTFYWLVNKGKIDSRQTNSDYNIASKKIKNQIDLVKNNGFENGLHKSISEDSFKVELSKLPLTVVGNRYHYLKFKLPDAYNKIEESGLLLDASLGFAEHYGFRNGYGYPFHPYNINSGSPYSFLEVPLNVMDGTFQRYMQIPVEKTADTIIDFLEMQKMDAVISILWHNTFFTNYKYKGYLNEYKKILSYLYETEFQNINQNEIINQFSWKSK